MVHQTEIEKYLQNNLNILPKRYTCIHCNKYINYTVPYIVYIDKEPYQVIAPAYCRLDNNKYITFCDAYCSTYWIKNNAKFTNDGSKL